ncbi:hypothetical protein ACJX0J_009701, partial [Zea mays]
MCLYNQVFYLFLIKHYSLNIMQLQYDENITLQSFYMNVSDVVGVRKGSSGPSDDVFRDSISMHLWNCVFQIPRFLSAAATPYNQRWMEVHEAHIYRTGIVLLDHVYKGPSKSANSILSQKKT